MRTDRRYPLLIVATGLAAFVNSFAAPFLFDDHHTIVDNRFVHSILPLHAVSRTLVEVSFKLNYALGGLDPAGYHAVNLAIHIAAALVLYGLVRRTLLLPVFGNINANTAHWIAGFSALLWVSHPLQTESVTYICQRSEALMGFCFLLTVYGFARGTSSTGTGRVWYNLSIAACLAGMMSKEVMAAAPFVLFLYDRTFVSCGFREAWRKHRAVYIAMLLCLAVPACLMVGASARLTERGIYAVPGSSPMLYLASQPGVIVRYLRLAAFPHPLCLDYDWPTAAGLGEVILPVLALLIVAGLAVHQLFVGSAVGFLLGAFFLILAPTSSVLPLDDLAFEHRMYLPLACLVVLFVTVVRQAAGRLWRRDPEKGARITGLLLTGLVLGLVSATLVRNEAYRSEVGMWQDVTAKRPENLRARNDLAVALCEIGRFDEAVDHYRYVLDRTASEDGRADQVIEGAVAANSMANNRYRALANMGLMAYQRGQPKVAIDYFVRALRIAPGSPDVTPKLARVLRESGVAQDRLGAEIERLVGQE